KECKKQIYKHPGALYKKFNTKIQAEEYTGNKKNNKEQIKVWTDSCYQNNRKTNTKAGIGIYFNDSKKISKRLSGKLQTNNYAEIYAVIRALEYSKNDKEKILVIYTDSNYQSVYKLKRICCSGHDVSINIIPDADIKIVLTADLTTHIAGDILKTMMIM
ncbi:11570_t:CDS:2, partial [Gigaspora margarita]